MSEFKPTKPGWYWDEFGNAQEVFLSDNGKLIVFGEDDYGDSCSISVNEIVWLAPVVPLEDGPGINAIQRQCLETALPTTTLEYCLLGLAGESGEVMEGASNYWESRSDVNPYVKVRISRFVELGFEIELLKKDIRAGKERQLSPLPDHCKPAIVKELIDVLWYGLVGLDRCGVSASEAFEQLRIKLQARKEAGTLAATTKREGEG